MKYGSQPTGEESGVCPLLEIKRSFAALEYSGSCLPLGTTQTHKYVSDTASPTGGSSFYTTGLGNQAGRNTRLQGKNAKCCHANRCRSRFAPSWHALLHLQNKTHRGKRKGNEKASKSLPTCLIFHKHNYFPRDGKGTGRSIQ